jgi:predicted PurR-regulated permease PerM
MQLKQNLQLIITMDNPTIQTDLIQILNKLDSKIDRLSENIDKKIDKIDDRLNKLEIGQAEIKAKVENVEKEISNIKGSQSKQVWALIGIVFSAVGILGKLVFFPPH